MKIKRLALVSILTLGLLANKLAHAADPQGNDASTVAALVTAVEKADYAAFVGQGELPFKQLPEAQFRAVSERISPRLKSAHELTFLGDLQQRGYRVSLWRLRFTDGGDDLLATLSVKDNQVGGFYLR